MKQYTILRIYEEDYGCEGIQPGEEPMCRVQLSDADGQQHWIKVPDAWLIERGLDEGDTMEWEEFPQIP